MVRYFDRPSPYSFGDMRRMESDIVEDKRQFKKEELQKELVQEERENKNETCRH